LIAVLCDDPQRAARLLGAADALRESSGNARGLVAAGEYEALRRRTSSALGDAVWNAAFDEGRSMTAADAVAYATRGRGARRRPASGWDSLTPAELDVVRFACAGLTNPQIATRLFVSPRTVQTHLASVYGKLGLSTRTEVAAEAVRRGVEPAAV
jgi:DNA-binding CsgD family transcriptional regulator